MGAEGSFPGLKLSVCKIAYLSSTYAEAKNTWICTPTSPYVFMVLCYSVMQGTEDVMPLRRVLYCPMKGYWVSRRNMYRIILYLTEIRFEGKLGLHISRSLFVTEATLSTHFVRVLRRMGARGSTVVKALCYKLEGLGFEARWSN
jgi:hypothetical protein